MSEIEKLRDIMATLRDPKTGCPWDLQQNFASIVPHTLEEAYEVAEAIEMGDMGALQGELGDLLFQVVFYARLAEEQGAFDFSQVVEGIIDKMLRRHPHVFGETKVASVEAQNQAWELQKAKEREARAATGKAQGALAGVATTLPAITRAVKLQKRAARVGFEWPDIQPALDKVQEELNEITTEINSGGSTARIEEEMGDLLFACANLARQLNVEPESALRHANRKFEGRFSGMEQLAEAQGKRLSQLNVGAWLALWQTVKETESG
jgi:nucleoside triphosphate diphosphatase